MRTNNSNIYPDALVVNSPYNQMGTFGVNGSSAFRHSEPLSNISGILWSKEKKLYMNEAYKKAMLAYFQVTKKTMTYNEWLKTPMAKTFADKYDTELKGKLDKTGQTGVTGFLNSAAGNSLINSLTNVTAIASGQPLIIGNASVGDGTEGAGAGDGDFAPDTKGKNTTTWLLIGGGLVLIAGIVAIVLLSGKKSVAVAVK